MFRLLSRALLASSLTLLVAACNKEPAAPGADVSASASSPDAAIQRSVELLKAGDIAGLMQNSLPPVEFAKAKADWLKNSKDKPITDEDRAKFTETMSKLTAPDADQKLYAEIEPQLKAFDAQYQTQIPVYVAMGSSWLQGMVQQNKDMSEADKNQTIAAINALGGWVQKTRFTDPESIKKVLAIATRTARAVDLKTLDQARALNFDESMAKARIAFLGFKDVLGVYGFPLDKTLDSVKTEVISNDGKTAKVKVNYVFFDAPLSVDTDMVNVDGRWYGKRAIDKLNEKKVSEAAGTPPAAAPAAASAAKPAPAPVEKH